jgi:cytidylate kinase
LKVNVAIDGPAGAGKSTIAKILASRFNLMYINTGSMYRAVALYALENGTSPENVSQICSLLDNLEMHFEGDNLIVNNEDITEKLVLPFISKNVSSYAAIPEVRERLVELQRDIAKKYDVVMDGRDIGTVVLKDAAFKFFLTAAPEERAKRRYEELLGKGIEVNYNDILNDIIKRDFMDSHREVDPLKMAEDAIEIDSSFLSIEEVVDEMSIVINRYINEGSEL